MGNAVNIGLLDHSFQHLFEEAPFAAALYAGPEFIIEMANETSLNLWRKDGSVIGMPLLKAMPEAEHQPFFHILKKVYESGSVYEGRERTAIQDVNGNSKKVYINFVYKAIRDDDKNVRGVLAIGYDVTHQVAEKQKLEELEERARMAIESAGLGTFDLDYKTGTIITTKRFANIFGFDASVQLSDYLSRIHPDDLPIRNAAELQAYETGKFQYEVRLLMPDRSFRWIRVNGTLIFDEDNLPTRLIGIALDITDEKNSIEKLQESEERFRTLITETPEVGAGLYVGRELRIQYVNDVMLRVWGKDASVVGKTLRQALPELEGQPFFDQLEKVYTTGVDFKGKEGKAVLEVNGKLQTGYLNYTYKALRRPNGEIYGIHHMSVDVTEQVLNKLKLIESEAAVRRLFEQTPVGIGIFNGESLIIENINAALLSYGGRRYEDVINQPLFSVIPEIEGQGIKEIAQHVYSSGIPYTSPEARIKLFRNGKMETIYVHFAFQPRKDEYGKITGLMVISNEITALVKARKRVEKNEQLLKNLANSMPQVVWIAENDGTVSYYNNRVREFSGAQRLEDGGWTWEWRVHPEDMKATTEAWNYAVKNLTTYQHEHRVMMTNGAYRWHLSRAYPFQSDEGIKWYGTSTDVHDQKVLEMDLENLVRERTMALERSNDDLEQFAHVASHDLKEPLRKIKTFAYKLKDELQSALGEVGNVYVNKILHSTDRMYAMINGVLHYSSIHAVDHIPHLVDLNSVIKNILLDLEILIQEKKAIINFEQLPAVKGISALLYQLFYNLINNSLKFSKENIPNVIDIRSSEIDLKGLQYVEIIINDTGIGFDESYAEKIFATFVRLHPKDKYEGTGLGLALCKKIVERHGGFIFAQGDKNIGAQFTVLLPK